MNRFSILLIAVVPFVFVPMTAAAEGDAPYTPKSFSIDELIVTEHFQSPPISFPWERVSTDRVHQRGRLDFALTYDVDYDTVRDALERAARENQDVVVLEGGAIGYVDVSRLRIAGRSLGNHGGRITLGHPDMEPKLIVDIEADGARTQFIVQNHLRTRQFSGFVPSRIGFLPAGAEPVPFRWD